MAKVTYELKANHTGATHPALPAKGMSAGDTFDTSDPAVQADLDQHPALKRADKKPKE